MKLNRLCLWAAAVLLAAELVGVGWQMSRTHCTGDYFFSCPELDR
jgi:hypothetical protein